MKPDNESRTGGGWAWLTLTLACLALVVATGSLVLALHARDANRSADQGYTSQVERAPLLSAVLCSEGDAR